MKENFKKILLWVLFIWFGISFIRVLGSIIILIFYPFLVGLNEKIGLFPITIMIGFLFILGWFTILIYKKLFPNKEEKREDTPSKKSGNYKTKEEFTVALQKELGDLGIKVNKKEKAEINNPNRYDVKFFRSQGKSSKPSFYIKAEVPFNLEGEFFKRMSLLYNIPLSWNLIRREFSQKIKEEILHLQSSPIDIEYLSSPNYAILLKATKIAQGMYRRGEIKKEEITSKIEELCEKLKNEN